MESNLHALIGICVIIHLERDALDVLSKKSNLG